jgi:hypothetical protein
MTLSQNIQDTGNLAAFCEPVMFMNLMNVFNEESMMGCKPFAVRWLYPFLFITVRAVAKSPAPLLNSLHSKWPLPRRELKCQGSLHT